MGPNSTFRKIHSVRIKLNCKTQASAAELLAVGKAPHTSGVETKENCFCFCFFSPKTPRLSAFFPPLLPLF